MAPDEALDDEPIGVADDYMGRPVTAMSVKITKAGDGLSKQLGIEPRLLVPGEKYRVLLEGVAGDHTHKLIEKADSWELVQVLEAETVTFVDDKASESKLRVAKDRVAKHEKEKKGEGRLKDVSTGADVLDAANLEVPDGIDGKSAGAGERPDHEWDDPPGS